jgi:DNA mismatch repair ATPase MutS
VERERLSHLRCVWQWILTGPNMSGKSTVLRAITAAALLANCGLAAPIAEGSTPVPRLVSGDQARLLSATF